MEIDKKAGESMECPKCGARLSEKNFCTGCGEDVTIYKKIMKISNTYYNDGLEKARVRDLSGAIESLKRSLKYNKRNMMARNLLGLIYYEIGEVVEALSQWVLSANYQKEKNIANDYIKAIQANPGRLEDINQTIRKFNQALIYCQQGSGDLAVIQLKKVLSMNSKMIQAYQLLGLLYIEQGEPELARRTLNKALKIDTTNTRTLRYLRETRKKGDGNSNRVKVERQKDRIISYQDGNETIIQPMPYKESTGVSTLINIMIGLVIGLAVAWFLIIPARQEALKSDYKDQNVKLGEELATKNAEAKSMQETIDSLTAQVEQLNGTVSGYEGDNGLVTTYEALIKAANAHIAGDGDTAFEAISGIKKDGLSEEAAKLYQSLMDTYGSQYVEKKIKESYDLYQQKKYAEAVPVLQEVLTLDDDNAQAMYYLARCYQVDESLLAEPERTTKVKELLSKVIELAPGTQMAEYARSNMPQ